MLGISISERTVSRIIRTIPGPPTQTWKTFLRNHLSQTVSMDFFTVPTIRMRVLFVFVVLEHGRREVLHFNVTEHPTAAWTSQQIREASADREPTRYAIRDRDGVYGHLVHDCIASLGMEQVLTAPQSPWQNPLAERLIGTIRRECLDHFVIFNAQASEESARALFPLLSRLENLPRTGQAVSVSARGVKRWKGCRTPAARRSPSPV
jgi:transposase InsO family protein